jgi:ectoine hydroxylase-related dioxygenase (phytanoyl-CoA dioxygenase family)
MPGAAEDAIPDAASAPPSMRWLDEPDAEARIAAARVGEEAKSVARAICRDGLAVIRGAHAPELCRAVIADYASWSKENAEYVRSNLDERGHEKRLVNFHLRSSAAARIGTAARVMAVLDFLFGREAAVYTSLTFKYGSQQPVHRDTPHFATWPTGQFTGVWTALEDVRPDAGPLFYHPGAHRFALDPRQYMDEAIRRLPDATPEQQCLLALDLYNGEVIRRAPTVSPASTLEMAAGDTVIWHPELPHGGLPAANPDRTRWSIVFHCSPAEVQVHQHDRYFGFRADGAPPDRYGFDVMHGRRIARAGGVSFM